MAMSGKSKSVLILGLIFSVVFLARLFDLNHKNPGHPQLSFGRTVIDLELAQTEAEKEQGLSGRANLPESAGMLFVYTHDVQPNFWMKDMHFPLDIIWLDANYRISAISPQLAPETYPQTFAPAIPIRYVLEVNAGFVDKHGLKVGEEGVLRAYN